MDMLHTTFIQKKESAIRIWQTLSLVRTPTIQKLKFARIAANRSKNHAVQVFARLPVPICVLQIFFF